MIRRPDRHSEHVGKDGDACREAMEQVRHAARAVGVDVEEWVGRMRPARADNVSARVVAGRSRTPRDSPATR